MLGGFAFITTYLGPPLPIEDGFAVIKVDNSGIVTTSTHFREGELWDEYFYYSKTSRREISTERLSGGGATVQRPHEFYYYSWLGTKEEYFKYGSKSDDKLVISMAPPNKLPHRTAPAPCGLPGVM